MLHCSQVVFTISDFSRHIGDLVADWLLDLSCFHHLVALPFSGKVSKAFPVTPSGYEMATPILIYRPGVE